MHHHYEIRHQKTILMMVLGGEPNSRMVVRMEPPGNKIS